MTIDVKVNEENVAWSEVFTSGDGSCSWLTYDVANLAEVGLYVKVKLADEGRASNSRFEENRNFFSQIYGTYR